MSFTNILASRLAASGSCCGKVRLPTYQQVRNKRTFQLRFRYGLQPILTSDNLEEVKESGKIDELSYKKIRFALIDENCSPLWDKDLFTFTKFVMEKGKKSLANRLMHETFYELKCIQYKRLKKKLAKDAKELEAGEVNSETGIQKSIGATLEIDQQNIEVVDEDEESRVEINPLTIFKKAMKNIEPIVITKKVKRGGAAYQVPFPLDAKQSEFLAIKWLISAVTDRPKPRTKHFPEVMSQELLDAASMRGKVIKRRDDIHKLADANKAYAHYRWG